MICPQENIVIEARTILKDGQATGPLTVTNQTDLIYSTDTITITVPKVQPSGLGDKRVVAIIQYSARHAVEAYCDMSCPQEQPIELPQFKQR